MSLKYFKIQTTRTTPPSLQAPRLGSAVDFLVETLEKEALRRKGLFHVDAPAGRKILGGDPKIVTPGQGMGWVP